MLAAVVRKILGLKGVFYYDFDDDEIEERMMEGAALCLLVIGWTRRERRNII
jgi:hypothetical protein